MSTLIDRRAPVVEEINQLMDSGSPEVEALSELEKRLPTMSTKVLNTRNYHRILATQARFTKVAIALGRSDLKCLQDKYNI